MREKPVVGQRLFSLNIGNAARNCEQVLTEVEVVKVGRKYFTCRKIGDDSGWSDTSYSLDTWRQKTDYSETSCLYLSRQGREDEKEEDNICGLLQDAFRYGGNRRGIPLPALRQIWGIAKEYGEEP